MPIYEYRCEPCETTFETLIRSNGDVAHCPDCGSIDVEKQFSVPAAAKVEGGLSTASSMLGQAPGPMGGGCGAGGCGMGMCGLG